MVGVKKKCRHFFKERLIEGCLFLLSIETSVVLWLGQPWHLDRNIKASLMVHMLFGGPKSARPALIRAFLSISLDLPLDHRGERSRGAIIL